MHLMHPPPLFLSREPISFDDFPFRDSLHLCRDMGRFQHFFSLVMGFAFSPGGGCMFSNNGVYGRNKMSFSSSSYGDLLMRMKAKELAWAVRVFHKNLVVSRAIWTACVPRYLSLSITPQSLPLDERYSKSPDFRLSLWA